VCVPHEDQGQLYLPHFNGYTVPEIGPKLAHFNGYTVLEIGPRNCPKLAHFNEYTVPEIGCLSPKLAVPEIGCLSPKLAVPEIGVPKLDQALATSETNLRFETALNMDQSRGLRINSSGKQLI